MPSEQARTILRITNTVRYNARRGSDPAPIQYSKRKDPTKNFFSRKNVRKRMPVLGYKENIKPETNNHQTVNIVEVFPNTRHSDVMNVSGKNYTPTIYCLELGKNKFDLKGAVNWISQGHELYKVAENRFLPIILVIGSTADMDAVQLHDTVVDIASVGGIFYDIPKECKSFSGTICHIKNQHENSYASF